MIAFTFFSPLSWAEAPKITSIDFPAYLPQNASSSGQVFFEDPDGDVSYAQFDVADGRYFQKVVSSNASADQPGQLTFSLGCTAFGQQVTLGLTLFDAAGEQSEPEALQITCGRPSRFNFSAEISESLPMNQLIPINIFIIDDGVTSLADDAQFSESSFLGTPTASVLNGIQTSVIANLSSVWDQCGLGFELLDAWVVKPENISVSGGTLENLFTEREGHQVIEHGQETGDILRQASFRMWSEAQLLNPRAAHGFNVLIMGSGIVAQYQGSSVEVEGFSSAVWPNYALVRQGTLLDGVLPRQMIATLAHELGHNLGLAHPGEDALFDVVGDHMNLMKGSGVSPQPRANLLQSQCEMALNAYESLLSRMPEIVDPEEGNATEGGASIDWDGEICTEGRCTGTVELKITTDGFESLDAFSFASFEISSDGEDFFEIAIDRRYQDGFNILWDTTEFANGTYTLRAAVTDSKGMKALVTMVVTVAN